MGYQLTYELQVMKIVKNSVNKDRYRYLIMIAILIIGTVALHFCTVIFETVLLGQGETAKAAAEQMVENIREGTSLSEAIQAFCTELAQ